MNIRAELALALYELQGYQLLDRLEKIVKESYYDGYNASIDGSTSSYYDNEKLFKEFPF